MFNSRSLKGAIIVATAAIFTVGGLLATENKRQEDGTIAQSRTVQTKESSVTMEFVLVPAGEFIMGSPIGESSRGNNEGPQHQVKLTKPFYMLTTEVTQQQYIQIMGINPSVFKGANNPVEMVSWNDAIEFCRKLSKKTGKKITLPTEAQWEYACRAGTNTRFSFGEDDQFLDSYCWYKANSSKTSHPVATKKPNAWGLFDMHGNVQEWCSDQYSGDYYLSSPRVDPEGPSSGQSVLHVFRGGSHAYVPDFCRSATRSGSSPDDLGGVLGFRIVFPSETNNDKKIINITLTKEVDKIVTTQEKKRETQPYSSLVIAGAVRDPAGIPIDDVDMWIIPIQDWILRDYAEGLFEISWSPSDPNTRIQGHHFIARHEQRNLAVGVEIEEDVNILDIRLKPGVMLDGKIVDPNGKGIEGATVAVIKLQTPDWSGRYLNWLKTDAEGRFKFRALPPGYDYVLSARKVHYLVGQTEVHSDSVRNNHIDGISIVLPRGRFSVSGLVVDANGKPVPNVWVYCTGRGQAGINSHTDAEGCFKADGIFEGQVDIMASIRGNDGGWLGGNVSVEAGSTDVRIVLQRNATPPPKGRTCFPAGTNVWVNGALVEISRVAPGQTVGKINCAEQKASFGQIKKIEQHTGIFTCRDIILENGNRISVVDAHCFMLDSGRWTAAQDLRSGLRLKTLKGAVTIKSVTKRETPFIGKVYNLKIKDSDRYMVGKEGVIVRDY